MAQQQNLWRYIGETVCGASHTRIGLTNQDAILGQVGPTGIPPAILAVSDGHGSPKCFRSHYGSGLAVNVAKLLAERFLRGEWQGCSLSIIKRTVEERLPRELVIAWQDLVSEHIKQNPFTESELQQLEAKEGEAVRKKVQENPVLAYGATLLVAVAASNFILYLQLGDGDILAVDPSGGVSRPLPADERLFANETTSLSGPTAWTDFRSAFQPVADTAPILIILSTDGYANSFRDEANFVRVGSDLLQIIREDGLDAVATSLTGWLNEASTAGSGDDVTLGLLCRVSGLNEIQKDEAKDITSDEVVQTAVAMPESVSTPDISVQPPNESEVHQRE
jgi:serine/threonine protein phosphatase PrpC